MRKIATLIMLIIALLFASCKKDYVCKCTVYGVSSDKGDIHARQRKADSYCKDLEKTISGMECQAAEM